MQIFINKLLRILKLKIVKLSYFEYVQKLLRKYNFIRYIEASQSKNLEKIFNLAIHSKSENSQDIMVLDKLDFKKKGFFVEFGAGDGKLFSNTYLLEKFQDWNGIVAEPCKSFHEQLKQNRNCNIDLRVIAEKSGSKIEFVEYDEKHLSRIYKNNMQNFIPKKKINYYVESVSLLDLLKKYDCPNDFDYLSIDTEGSEYEIIKNFDFDNYKPKIISIEHNFVNIKKKLIFDLLSNYGYTDVFESISDQDSWYILKDS